MNNNIKVNKLSVTLLRALTSGIFIIAGISGHLINPQRAAARIEQAVFKDFAYFFGDPVWLVIITGVMMTLAGISFLIGFKTKWAAIVLLAVLVPITVTMQIGQMNTLGPLFKNVAITGSLLFFILNDGFQSKVLARPSETAVQNADLSGKGKRNKRVAS
ncbi:MAG: DoxX family protein [Mangrovibacterium sp.]